MEIKPHITQEQIRKMLDKYLANSKNRGDLIKLIEEHSAPPPNPFRWLEIKDPKRYKDPFIFYEKLKKISEFK